MFERYIDDSWSFKTANTKEYTHCYHTYPAMMIPQVARRLIEEYVPDDGCNMIFDPYMGSGTSLVEATIKGINCIGTDLNPLARLISQAKTTHYNISILESILSNIQLFDFVYSPNVVKDKDFSRISNYSFWYSDDVLLKLSFISQFIENIESDEKLFLKVALSEVVREVSYTRNSEFKRFKMPEDKIKSFKPDVFRMFEEKVTRNIRGLKEYNLCPNKSDVKICDFNSVVSVPDEYLPNNSVDMIVTSPPYGDSRTTVAYGQFSRWANEWFGFPNAKNLDSVLMGGNKQQNAVFDTYSIKDELKRIEDADTKRYGEVVSFLNDYYNSIKNIAPTVREGGRVCYVVGNRTVKGVQIPLDFYTAEMFEKFGFKHNITIVRRIPNKRMPSKTSPTNKTGIKVDTMSNEYIVIMTKA